jgi:hypothetical protein
VRCGLQLLLALTPPAGQCGAVAPFESAQLIRPFGNAFADGFRPTERENLVENLVKAHPWNEGSESLAREDCPPIKSV